MTGVPFTRLLGTVPSARLAVEMAFGADLSADPGTWTWSDVTTDVLFEGGKVAISPMGRSDEASTSQPAGQKCKLLNTTGNYSKAYPAGSHFPFVRRNTPTRVSVLSSLSPTLRSVATTASGTVVSFAATAPAGVVAGDVVIAFQTSDATYLGEMKTPTGANWRLLTTVETTDITGGHLATKVWYYRATGAAPASYTFTQGGPGTSDGVVTIAAIQNAAMYSLKVTTSKESAPGTTFDTPSSNPLRTDDFELRWVGGSSSLGVAGVTWTPPGGLTERSDVQSGSFTTGSLATRVTGATTATGVKTFTCSSGALDWAHGVTVNFSNTNVRFQGNANGFAPQWDTSAKIATVGASASGVLRRLGRYKAKLQSPYRRAIAQVSPQPIAYWPLEEGSKSWFGVPDVGSAGMYPTDGSNALANGTLTGFGGGDGLDDCPKIYRLHVGVGLAAGLLAISSPNSWTVEWVARYKVGQSTGFGVYMIRLLTSGTYDMWEVGADAYWWVLGTDTGVASTGLLHTVNRNVYDGKLHHFRLELEQSGGNVLIRGYADGNLDINETLFGSNMGLIQTIEVAPTGTADPKQRSERDDLPDVGHVAVWNGVAAPSIDLNAAALGWVGETATARLTRLCAEQGVSLDLRGTSDTAMGTQAADTFVNLLRECETADDGVLYDGRGSGLSYVARSVRYNAPVALTADMAANPPQIDDPFNPADDDQRDLNLMKIDRKNGSSATYEDDFSALGTQAIGTYDDSMTVNIKDDSGLVDRAAWEVHKGTVDVPYRYPTMNLDLGATPAIIYDWLSADVSSRVVATNVDTKTIQHPPGDIDLLLEGWAEVLSPFEWTVTGNCSPFAPWRVAAIEGIGDTTWRIDAGNSTLQTGAAVGATSISVATSSGPLWSTSAGDYPRLVDVGGVPVNVTAVSGASSPQTFTVDPLKFALTAGWKVKLRNPPTIAL